MTDGPCDLVGASRRLAPRVVPLLVVGAAWATGRGPLGVRPLPAQTVRAHPDAVTGAVRDSVTRQPLHGAVILLRDSLDRTVGQTVTNEGGRYYVAASAAARRIRVLRMGFRPADVPLPTAGAPPRLALGEIALVPVPPLLAPVRVTAAARCPARANGAAALGLLEQMRTGLLSAVIARAQQPPALTVLNYERQYDAPDEPPDAPGSTAGARIVRQSVRTRATSAATAPFGASRTGAAFVADGFRQDSAGASHFYAPDAETLMDDDFVAGYCFRVVASAPARPHEVGLGFAAPRPRAGRIDVDGVLWVDTVARSLGELTFRYVGLDPQVTALRPGGRLAFREMPTGVAFIDRWSLRVVSSQSARGRDRRVQTYGSGAYGAQTSNDGTDSPRLVAREVGGELARVAWPDGRAWRAPLGTWRLRLTDRNGRPAAGAVVRLDSTDYAGTADSAGVVELTDLLPGPYTASIVDPLLAARDRARPATLRVVAARDSTVETRLVIDMAERVVAARPPAPASPAPTSPAPASPAPRGVAPRPARDTSSVAIGGGKTIERLFTGRFPGVTVTRAANGGLQIRIRGGSNSFLAGEEPLYIVDGTPLPAGTGGIVFLNPYDIEKIEVLKNAADVALYGVRGGNGVIRITTLRPPGRP